MTDAEPPRLGGCKVMPPMSRTDPVPSSRKPITPTRCRKQTEGKKRSKQKTKGRFELLNAFVDEQLADLAENEVKVWLILYRDTRDGTAKTSQQDIARRAGISDRTVRRMISQLERKGLLKVVFQGGINRGPSRYRVLAIRE